jgi:hypothetical protein
VYLVKVGLIKWDGGSIFMGLINKDVVLLMRCIVICESYLELFKRCWVRGIECLTSIIIKKL